MWSVLEVIENQSLSGKGVSSAGLETNPLIADRPPGAGSDFGVTPSISLRPSGHTITRSNVILLPNPPLDSDAVSVVGRTLPRSRRIRRTILNRQLRQILFPSH